MQYEIPHGSHRSLGRFDVRLARCESTGPVFIHGKRRWWSGTVRCGSVFGPSNSALQILPDQPSRRAARSRILVIEHIVLDTKFFARRIRNDEQRTDYFLPRWKY